MKKALTGNGAAAYFMRQANPDVVAAYPITPSTQIMEDFSEYYANGLVDSELILVESEHSALSACIGASSAGARAITATSSQGLALMWEMLSIASGLRLPIIMNVINRSLSSPINIHCDHSDSMGARDQGWIQIYSESPQEVYINNLIALKLAEKMKLPVMICQDGFVTSHCVTGVEVLDDNIAKNFIDEYKPKYTLLKDNITIGSLALPDYYFEIKKQVNDKFEDAGKEFLKIDNELNKILKHETGFFEEYRLKDADTAIVVMGSTSGAVKEVVNALRKKNKKVGLLKLRLFRPFPYKAVKKVLEHVKNVVVMDRSLSFGSYSPLYSDIKSALGREIKSVIYGLGGRNIYEKDIEDIFTRAMSKKLEDVEYIGVRE